MSNTSQRLVSLDVLRGITISGMILVNNPGNWGAIYTPFEHAPWTGMTPTDLIFPFFIFIMGVSMYLSLSKQEFKFTPALAKKIVVRSIMLFAIGVILNFLGPFFKIIFDNSGLQWSEKINRISDILPHIRILGVFQRFAVVYLIGSLIILSIPRIYIGAISIGILVFYSFLLLFGNGFEFSTDNIIAVFDKAILTEPHMYKDWLPSGDRIIFDPEGLLSNLPAVAHVLIGFFVGSIIKKAKNLDQMMVKLSITGIILLFSGFLFVELIPLSKKIWSPTFVLVSAGFATLALTLLIWIIDDKQKQKWSKFFVTFGVNPLAIYIFATIFAALIETIHPSVFGLTGTIKDNVVYLFDHIFIIPKISSLLFAIFFVVLNWTVCNWLYKRGIILKL
ncbi:MAG: DUF5009 domain-containing protein [Bacteroidales bacterium]|nr:DUF5009 domain-containing protein [Bacteroidales bacterium]